jgi:tripartite-type tricarboxylate transporter receptor subunit TctC
MRRELLKAFCLAVLLAGSVASARADNWPSRPIKFIVPYAAGGSSDLTARLVAEQLRNVLGQSVVVENRVGGGGNIGALAVAKSEPDGYTLLLATSSHVTNMSLFKSLPYDFVRDFVPVSQIAFIPNVLVVTPQVPAANLSDFIAYAKSGRSTLSYGSAGHGSSQHLSGSLFNYMIDGKILHVPYKGGSQATQDLIAGQIQLTFGPMVEVIEFIRSGHVRALGVTTLQRSPLLPDVPAINEALPGYEVALWNGIVAPAKTPPDIVQKLGDAIAKVLRQPEMRAKLLEQGSEPIGNTPDQFRQFIASEVGKWDRLVKLSGAQVEN